jgi:hypothetical protein
MLGLEASIDSIYPSRATTSGLWWLQVYETVYICFFEHFLYDQKNVWVSYGGDRKNLHRLLEMNIVRVNVPCFVH